MTETVYCELHGAVPHQLTDACTWPHLVAPAGPVPSLGHPLTPHD